MFSHTHRLSAPAIAETADQKCIRLGASLNPAYSMYAANQSGKFLISRSDLSLSSLYLADLYRTFQLTLFEIRYLIYTLFVFHLLNSLSPYCSSCCAY